METIILKTFLFPETVLVVVMGNKGFLLGFESEVEVSVHVLMVVDPVCF